MSPRIISRPRLDLLAEAVRSRKETDRHVVEIKSLVLGHRVGADQLGLG